MNGYGLTDSYSSLYPIMNGHDARDSSSEVPYEKGFQFLMYLESLMDKPEDFQAMLQAYIKKYSKQSVTFLEFRLTFMDFVKKTYSDNRA